MITFDINSDELLKWARHLEEVKKETPAAIARALNAMGDQVLRVSTDYLAESTGLDSADVHNAIRVQQATPTNLEWKMDASAITLMDAPNWERPWETPNTGGNFNQQQLLKIVTMEDDYDCEVCRDAADDSPYTVERINQLAAKWKDYVPPTPNIRPGVITNLIHPRCRCVTMPWAASRQLNVNFASTPASPPVVLTARDMGEFLATELGGALKVK